MGLLESLGTVLLVIINIIFVIVSLCLVAIGFVLRFGGSLLKQYSDEVLKSVKQSVANNFNGQQLNTDDFDITELFGTIAIALIVSGFILFIISFCGCCGACCKVKCMLLVYAVILILLLIGQIVIISLMFAATDSVKDVIKSPMKSLLTNYKGLNGSNVESLGWNFVMQEFDCCGVEDYKDFKTGTQWWGVNEHLTPYACCKKLPDSAATRDACAGASSTAPVTSLTNSNYDKGCVDQMWAKLMDQTTLYIALGLGIGGAAQLLMIVFAFIIYCNAKNDDKVAPSQKAAPVKHYPRNRVNPRSEW